MNLFRWEGSSCDNPIRISHHSTSLHVCFLMHCWSIPWSKRNASTASSSSSKITNKTVYTVTWNKCCSRCTCTGGVSSGKYSFVIVLITWSKDSFIPYFDRPSEEVVSSIHSLCCLIELYWLFVGWWWWTRSKKVICLWHSKNNWYTCMSMFINSLDVRRHTVYWYIRSHVGNGFWDWSIF